MKLTALLLLASLPAFAGDAPLLKLDTPHNLDAPGQTVILKPGETFMPTYKAVCLDEQEDVSRERDRVAAHTAADDWRKIAIGSITGGAVLAVTLAVVATLAAAHKL